MKVSGKFVITWNPNSDVVTANHFRNKKLPCPLVYFIVTMPVSFCMARISSVSLSNKWTWGQGEYNEIRKWGFSLSSELKPISSKSLNLTAHPLLFYFPFLLFLFLQSQAKKPIISHQEPGTGTMGQRDRQQEGRWFSSLALSVV